MTHTRTAKSRIFAGIATFATVTAVTIPLLATAASAAVSNVTVDSTSSTQVAAGGTATIKVNVTGTGFPDTTLIKYAVVSGPDADQAHNGTLVADGPCTITAGTATTETATCTVANNGTAGTDVIRVFADNNGNLVADSGEPFADATVVFYGAAANVDIKPDSDSAAAGTCNAFTVTVTDAGGRARPSQAVKLEANLTGTTTGRVIAFCNPGTSNPTSTNAGGDDSTAGTGSPTQAQGTVTTDANGKATFGIRSDQPGTATVRGYVDTNANSAFDAGEPNDTSNKTFTAGGAAGNSAQDAASTLTVTPPSQTAIVTDSVQYTVTVKNAAGDTTPNVVINYTITGANPGSGTLAPTDNNGNATLTYTANNAGTDNITFFVNQTTGGTAGPDASEPKATATTTVTAAPSGNTIDLTCKGTVANTSAEDCVDPVTDNNEVFTAFVSKGLDSSGNPAPAAGILVRFTTTGTDATVSPTSAVTDAKGIATTTLTDTTNASGTTDTVTATIAGQTVAQVGGVSSDSGTKSWATAVATTVTVAPPLNTTQTGSASTFVATVTDQFGAPVVGQNVDFYIAGRNASLNGPATLNKTTDAKGQATLNYTDVGPTNDVSAGNASDTITAVADVDSNDSTQNTPKGTAVNKFITEPATAGTVDLDVTGASSANCGVTATDPANDSKSYAPAVTTTTHSVCALVKTAGGAPLTGKTVTFTLTGVGGFAKADGSALTSPQTVTTDSNGVATILVNSTQSGAQNITAAIDGKSDAATITYTAATKDAARFIDLKPDTSNVAPGKNVELTARVTDRFGNPVAGVVVDFNENGPGRFSNGTSTVTGTTGATGTVTVTFTSDAGTTGTDTVSATINEQSTAGAPFPGNYTQCTAAADNSTTPVTPAGNCTDSSTYTFSNAASTPTFILGTNVIAAGQFTKVVVNGTPGDSVQILVKGAASSSYTVIATQTLNSSGTTFLNVSPSTSSSYFVRNATGSAAPKFLLVKAVQSINVSKSGTTGIFAGLVKPSLKGHTVLVYGYLTGGHVATLCTTVVRAGGHFACNKPGLIKGKTYHVFAQTGADKYNAAGRSGLKDLTI